jgi:hypothetical protein
MANTTPEKVPARTTAGARPATRVTPAPKTEANEEQAVAQRTATSAAASLEFKRMEAAVKNKTEEISSLLTEITGLNKKYVDLQISHQEKIAKLTEEKANMKIQF